MKNNDLWKFHVSNVDEVLDTLPNLNITSKYRNTDDEIQDVRLLFSEGILEFEVDQGLFNRDFSKASITAIELHNKFIEVESCNFVVQGFNDTKGQIKEMCTPGFDEIQNSSLVYAIGCKKSPNIFNFIESNPYESLTHIISGHFEVIVNSLSINIFEYKTKNKNSFLCFHVDSSTLSIQDFQELCYKFSIGIGYVIGYFHNDYAITLKVTNNEIKGWKYLKARGSIRSHYKPVTSDYLSCMSLNANEKTKLQEIGVDRISINSMNVMLLELNDSSRFQVLVLLLIESITGSLITAPSLLSVALEELSSLVLAKTDKSPLSIKNKYVARKIRKELIDIIEEKDDELFSTDGKNIIINKINNLNSRPNFKKLSKPYELFEIELSAVELDSLNQRNKFLHGETYHRTNKAGIAEEINNLVLLKTMIRLYHLSSLLMMKLIGHSGIIPNHVKLHVNDRYTDDEPLYRKI